MKWDSFDCDETKLWRSWSKQLCKILCKALMLHIYLMLTILTGQLHNFGALWLAQIQLKPLHFISQSEAILHRSVRLRRLISHFLPANIFPPLQVPSHNLVHLQLQLRQTRKSNRRIAIHNVNARSCFSYDCSNRQGGSSCQCLLIGARCIVQH